MTIIAKIPTMFTQVKELMAKMNFEICDKGIPAFEYSGEEVFGDLLITAAYAPEVHKIFFNTQTIDTCTEDELLQMLAHELTHSLQDMSNIKMEDVNIDVTSNEYWEQEFERQAYTIAGMWHLYHSETDVDMVPDQIDFETKLEVYGIEHTIDAIIDDYRAVVQMRLFITN